MLQSIRTHAAESKVDRVAPSDVVVQLSVEHLPYFRNERAHVHLLSHDCTDFDADG
jgi:hypothetical protein